jgi:aminopeptidase N
VLNVAALGGDAMLYDLYLAQLPKLSGQPEEYYRFFSALTWFRDPALVQRTLQFAVSPAVRTQDTGQLIGGLLARPWSREAAWTFVRTRWDTLTQLLGTFQGIPGIVRTLGSFCSRERAAEIREFFAAHPVPAVERTLRQSIERIENCAVVTIVAPQCRCGSHQRTVMRLPEKTSFHAAVLINAASSSAV